MPAVPIKPRDEIVRALLGAGRSAETAASMADGLVRVERDLGPSLTTDTLLREIASRGLAARAGLGVAQLAEFASASVFFLPHLLASLWPVWNYDQWKEFEDSIAKTGETHFSGPDWATVYHRKQGECDLAVKTRIDVTAHKNGTGEPLSGNKGVTLYDGLDVQTGHLLENGSLGGCFVYLVIKIAIHINLAAAGKPYTEENSAIKAARDKAGKSSHFDSLPLEFIVLHEEQHAKEMADTLAKIAEKAISCELGDSAAKIAALDAELSAAAKAMYADASGGVQGDVERRIRDATWNEWDRLHP